MAYETKAPEVQDNQPPVYGSPQPAMSQPYSPPPQGDMERSYSGQQYPQQPQQAYNQYPPQGQNQYPPQNQAPPMQQQQPAQEQKFQNVVPLASLQSSSAPVQCPSCGQRAMTRTQFVTGNTTHGWAAGLCCFLCLGCIPYLMSSMKDVEHRCGNCGVHLATWHRSGRTEVHFHS